MEPVSAGSSIPMKKIILLCSLTFIACRCFAVDGAATFRDGLQAFQANGPDALLNTWYGKMENEAEIAGIRARLIKVTHVLGPVVDTEVFVPRNLGRHVQILYGVIYFEKRPLWLRAEFYSIGNKGGFLSLNFSLQADEILPEEWGVPRLKS